MSEQRQLRPRQAVDYFPKQGFRVDCTAENGAPAKSRSGRRKGKRNNGERKPQKEQEEEEDEEDVEDLLKATEESGLSWGPPAPDRSAQPTASLLITGPSPSKLGHQPFAPCLAALCAGPSCGKC